MTSGCQMCAATGECDAAFHGGPGKFCSYFTSQSTHTSQPCCCPDNTVCKVSQFSCRCHIPSKHHYNYNFRRYENGTTGGLIAFVIIVILCCCCCGSCAASHQHYGYDGIADAEGFVPVAVPASGMPPPTAPGYSPGYAPRSRGSDNSGGGGFWGNVASGLGGFAVGEMFARNFEGGNHHHHGGGGFDFQEEGGYDIQGDSGGGEDILGDW
eukprot:CAMPEP_0197246518 /NCGR_PEP_ID=MMETSP1429-20130617/14718_1 /TAXON_ID=49237 /ORGANISM="Chaetoceros  sp., Strain UNC1202" /LENGTH=210 /DNA_ID=CAMNT_0042707193 /DNA_START=96 /DNA_END=725 /DNA_ORIENTATION=+